MHGIAEANFFHMHILHRSLLPNCVSNLGNGHNIFTGNIAIGFVLEHNRYMSFKS